MKRVVVLGAGATKDCGGPMTAEILPEAFTLFRGGSTTDLVAEFLAEVFDVPREPPREKVAYPGLPLLLSLIDTAIVRDDSFRPAWPVERMRKLRESLEQVVFDVIETMSRDAAPRHDDLVAELGAAPTVISLNYDLLADHAFMRTAGAPAVPDYGCDVGTATYAQSPRSGTLLKLHGSLNWLYCPACHQLEVRSTVSQDPDLHVPLPPLADREVCPAVRGRTPCGTRLRRVLITPSHIKDYRNPHIAGIWRRAEEALRAADEVVFIGYSLPWDDVEVIYLLKRGLAHLDASKITVVEWAPEGDGRRIENHEAGQRYLAVLGRVHWRCEGFAGWLKNG